MLLSAKPDHEAAWIASFFAIGQSITVLSLTAGTEKQPFWACFLALGVSLLLINLRPTFSLLQMSKFLISPVVGLVLAAFIVLLPFEIPMSKVAATLVASIGFLLYARTFVTAVVTSGREVVKWFFAACMYCFVMGQQVWRGGYRDPLDLLAFAESGSMHRDAAFHYAVAAMLKTYGKCSTGLDGPVEFNYHHVAHLMAAKLSLLLGLSVHDVLLFVTPVILSPLLVLWGLRVVSAVYQLRMHNVDNVGPYWLPHLVIWVVAGGLLPTYMLEAGFLWWNFSFGSDSQALGLVFLCAGVCLLLAPAADSKLLLTGASLYKRIHYVSLVAVITYAISVTKLPLAHLFAISVIYVCVRCSIPLGIRVAIVAVSICALLLGLHTSRLTTGENLLVSPLGLWLERLPFSSWPLMIPLNTVCGLTYAFLRFSSLRLITTGDLADAWRQRRLLDVEVVLLVTFAGTGLTMVFGGSLAFNSIYYQSAAQFLGILACAGVCDLWPSVGERQGRSLPLSVIAVGTVLAALLFTSLINSGENWGEIVRRNLQSRGSTFATPLGLPTEHLKPDLRGILRSGDLRLATQLIQKNTQYTEHRIQSGDKRMISCLREIPYQVHASSHRRTALWISRENRAFWDLARDGRRWILPMLAVGLSELALIDGLPEEPDPTGGAFGFNAYPVGAVTSKNSLSRSEVLLKARELHFEHVLELLPDGSVVSHAIEP